MASFWIPAPSPWPIAKPAPWTAPLGCFPTFSAIEWRGCPDVVRLQFRLQTLREPASAYTAKATNSTGITGSASDPNRTFMAAGLDVACAFRTTSSRWFFATPRMAAPIWISGERPKEKQSREEEAEGKQEEGLAHGFAVCFNRSAGEAQPKRRSKENPVTSRPLIAGGFACVRFGSACAGGLKGKAWHMLAQRSLRCLETRGMSCGLILKASKSAGVPSPDLGLALKTS